MCVRPECKYRQGKYGTCDYLSKTGTSRLKVIAKALGKPTNAPEVRELARGENCPLYRKRGEDEPPLQSVLAECRFSPVRRGRPPGPPLPEEELRKLYDQGLHDPAIAEKLGLKVVAVFKWRTAHSLPANYRLNRKADTNRLQEAYDKGLNDQQISRETGISAVTVQKWRHERKLPPRGKHGSTAGRDGELRALYDEGLNDKQMAIRAGLSPDTIKKWRDRNGLATNWNPTWKKG